MESKRLREVINMADLKSFVSGASSSLSRARKTIPQPSVTPQPVISRPVAIPMSSYQQPNQKWYSGESPTYRETLGRIVQIAGNDVTRGNQMMQSLNAMTQDPSTPFYKQYAQPTNPAVGNLQSLGFDTSNLTAEWIDANRDWIGANLITSDTTGAPTKPGKKATWAQNVAYQLYQWNMAEGLTQQAEKEREDAIAEAKYWASRTDLNLSDEGVIGKVRNNFAAKYPTLSKLETRQDQNQFQPIEINRGVDFSDDDLYAGAWEGRNPDYNGNIQGAMVQSYLGKGNVWKDNADIDAKLYWKNQDTYSPYSVGMTLEDEGVYFNAPKFTRETVEAIRQDLDLTDKNEVKMFNNVVSALNFTEQAQYEQKLFMDTLNKKLEGVKTEEEARRIVERLYNNGVVDKATKQTVNFGNLKKMDESLKGTSLINTTDAIDWKYDDVIKYAVNVAHDNENRKTTHDVQADLASPGTGIGASVQAAKADIEQRFAEAQNLLGDSATPAEEKALTYTGSSGYDTLRSFMDSLNPATFMSKVMGGITTGNVENALDTYQGYSAYQQAEARLPYVQAEIADLESRVNANDKEIGNLNYFRDMLQAAENGTLGSFGVIDIKEYSKIANAVKALEAGETQYQAKDGTHEYLMDIYEAISGDDNRYPTPDEHIAARKLAQEWFEYLTSDKVATGSMPEGGNERLRNLYKDERSLQDQLEANKESYAEYARASQANRSMLALSKLMGLDTSDLEASIVIGEYLNYFTEYHGTKWESYNAYDTMMQGLEAGASYDDVKEAAAEGNAKVLEQLEDLNFAREYAAEKGVQLPAIVEQGLEREEARLNRVLKDYEYFTKQEAANFTELAAQGKELEESQKPTTRPGNVAEYEMLAPTDYGLINASFYGIMTEEEKNTYYYLYASEGAKAAEEYYMYLANPTYGVLQTRYAESVREGAKAEVDSGFVGGVWANAKAILSAPLDFAGSLSYMTYAALTGEEFNPNNTALSYGKYAKAVNQATAESIQETFKDNPVAQTVLGGLYEMVYNRGRSMVNSLMTGGFTSMIGNEILQELAGAAPMAVSAMADAIAEAKDRGAQDWQAWLIGAATFFAEDFTEGITYGNIRDTITGSPDEVVVGFKNLMKNWLLNSGVEEMFGEGFNDWFENQADQMIMGELSEHSERVARIKADNEGITDAEAEAMARREELEGLAHTMVISYLGAGLDVPVSTMKSFLYEQSYARQKAKEERANGGTRSISEIRKEFHAQRMAGEVPSETQNAPQEQPAETAPATTEAAPEETDAVKVAKAVAKISAVRGADTASNTAAVASALGGETGTIEGDTATAAATGLAEIMNGNPATAANTVKNIMLGALDANVPVASVQEAIKTAGLSASSQARGVMASESFAMATGAQQAAMLAETISIDVQNPVVQQEAETAIHESRVAEAEKVLIANGALNGTKTAMQARDDVAAKLANAREELNKKTAETLAKSNAFEQATQEMAQNPTADNQKNLDRALNELNGAITAEEQYNDSVDSMQSELDKAQSNLNEVRDQEASALRQQAEDAVVQIDQQRAEAAAQLAEQQRIAAEQQAQAQAEAEENSNFARAQADEIISENYANASEEDKERIRGIVNDIQNESPMTETDKILARRDYVNRISKKFGYSIKVGDTTEGGRFLFQNASVNPKTGEITLSDKATVSDAMYAILIHEITHISEQSGLYKEMSDALLRLRYGDNTDQMNADIAARQDLYKKSLTLLQQQGKNVNPDDVTAEYARQELVADMMGALISGDQDLLNRFAAESPSVARRFIDAIKNFLKKMVGIQGAPLTEAQRIVDTLEAALKEVNARDSGERYSLRPGEAYQAKPLVTTEDSDGTTTDLATELPGGTVALSNERFSLNSFNDDEQKKVREALLNSGRFTRQQIDKYMDDALSIASMIAADRNRLDFKASDNQVFLKPNNDYYFTLDASTLCAKRLLYQGTFDYVQHALPDEVFTPEDLIDLVNIMNDMGYETPCGICYVESRRRWLDTYAQKFLDDLPTDADGFIEEYFKKATDEEKAAIRERFTEEKPSIDDLTTSDGLEKLRHDNPDMYKAFVTAMNNKGSANPKVVQLRTEYRGDIRKMTAAQIQNVKDIGGLRIQSFSDFETPHLLDMMQAVLDMSAAGLTSQAYTKVPNFAWVFGDTGIKINLSLIGKGTGLDENGNLVFDNREGMNFDEAMKIRDRYSKNVGTILVGINDEHIIAAMGDPRIDFIIPFHKSGWSSEELRKMPTLNNYKDYTSTQNERIILERVNKVLKEWKTKNDTALQKWIEENGDNYIGYRVENTEKGYRIVFDGYKTESLDKHNKRTKEKLSNLEPVGANQYWDFKKSGQWNAENYLKMCAEQHRMPKFSQFLVDNGDGSFSLPQGTDKRSTAIREGYWKTLIDFKMYENDGYGRTKEDGTRTKVKGSEQKAVTPNINMAEAYRVMDEYKLGRQMPNNPDGTPGRFIPIENNNSVPVAIPAGDRYIELIKAKREGRTPAPTPPNTLEADLPADARPSGTWVNPRASAFGNMSNTDAMLGNTESANQEETAEPQQNAMAIDAETGETVQRFSLPAAIDNVYEDMSTDELFSLLGINDEEEARNVMTVAVKDIKDEFDPTIYNGKLYVKPDTLDHWLSGSGFASTNPDYAQAYITTMDPADFLRMTTVSESGQNRVLDEATPLDAEKLSENGKRQPIYLIIDEETGKITGHEGRHRSIALSRAGVKEIPVLLFDSATKYSKTPKGQMVLEGQDFYDNVNGNTITFTDVLPLAGRYRDEIFEKYTASAEEESEAEANEQKIIRYSLPSDAPYLSAVNHGDMDRAQEMVDKAAQEAGYTQKVYHGTPNSGRFNVFDADKLNNSKLSSYIGQGFYFTNSKEGAMEYTHNVNVYGQATNGRNPYLFEGYLKLQNPIEITETSANIPFDTIRDIIADGDKRWFFDNGIAHDLQNLTINGEKHTKDEIMSMSEDQKIDLYARHLYENGDRYALQHMVDAYSYGNQGLLLKSMREHTGADGIHWQMKDGLDQFVAFDSSQFKDAAPVSYDDQGNVIPLSERFNTSNPDIRYSLPSDAPYLSAVNHGDMEQAQEMVNEKANETGYTIDGYHGTLNGGFVIFDKRKAHVGGNSGAGFYFSSNPTDSEANYSDVEGADNHFKVEHLVEKIQDYIAESGENEYAGVQIPEDASYEDLERIAKEMLQGNPQTYHVRLMPGRAYIRDGNNSTNLIEDAIENFDESLYDRNDYDNEDDYLDAISMGRSDAIYEAVSNAVYEGIADVDSNYEIISNVDYEKIISDLAMVAIDYEKLTMNDIIDIVGRNGIEAIVGDGEESADATAEVARAIVEAFGFNSIEDREVSWKFNQLKNMSGTVHYIMFKPNQIKLADPVTYDNDGNVIPLSERFKTRNNDIRYSLPSDDILREQIRYQMMNGTEAPLEGQNPTMSTGLGPAQRQFGQGMLQDSDDIDRMAKVYTAQMNSYFPDTNEDQVRRAIHWVRSLKQTPNSDGYAEALQAVTANNFDYRSADGQARMLAVMAMAKARNNGQGDTMAQVALADAFNRQGTDLGRALQARKIFRLMTPEGRISTLQRMMQNIQDELNAKGTNVDLKFSDWIYMAAASATEEGDFEKVQKAAAGELAEQIPANWKDKLTGWRMLAMLGNPRTHIRNVLGNALFMPAVGIKNKIGALAELGMAKENRTKTLGLATQDARAFARDYANAIKDELTGEAKYNDGNLVQQQRKTWGTGNGILSRTGGRLLQWLSDLNGNALEAEDWIFLNRHFRNALAGYMTARGLTSKDMTGKVLEDAKTYAIQEAQKATYRDANKLASTLSKIGREGGLTGFIVNAVLPFKKTPANILKRGIEYSPVGIVKALTSDAKHLKEYMDYQNGKLKALPEKAISPSQWIDKVSSGLTGTGIMALGFLLSSIGAVKAGLDDDDEFDKLRGEQDYSMNPGKVGNEILKLFGAPRIFGEDVSMTIDWAAPMSMPLFVGATLYNAIERLSEGDEIDVGAIADSILNITEPVFNLSMLDGVNSLLDVNTYGEANALTAIGEKVLTNYATSFVPTLLGQAARTIDTTRRKAFVPSGASLQTPRYALEQTENKIPFLSKTNIPYRNAWGDTSTKETLAAGLENFFSPAYINPIQDDAVTDELERLYNTVSDNNKGALTPKMPNKKLNNEALSAEQYDQLTVERGQTAHQVLADLMQTAEYAMADDETRAGMVADVWTYSTQRANYIVSGGKTKKDKWVSEAENDPAAAVLQRAVDRNKNEQATGFSNALKESLVNGDLETAQTAIAGMRRADKTNTGIKTTVTNVLKPLYQRAYLADDDETMFEIETMLDNLDDEIQWKYGDWLKNLDDVEEEEEETGLDTKWLNTNN